ncbi:hypothetical protein PP724_22865 [Ralstonia solanacearum]|uniref:hypothetical protein n=1 Tax=Ralstonia solanacearum TaxID=305 RepID=UPI001FFB9369|nr:hypothetical protein [Ralstonia solanacearum]MDC6237009.1 hypothetical protein [Ralstonia solanacearum]MDD7810558.1 hypothetical protein [Ralstonia solanacearum]
MKALLAGLALALLSHLAVAQTIPTTSTDAPGGIQRAPGPTPDDPMAAKFIAVDPAAVSFVEEYNARVEAFYNKMTTYYTVVDGYCVATPMTERLFLWINRR